MKTFGERLKEARAKNGMSQRDVAAVIECSQNTISNYELGNTYPSKEVTKKLADLYGVTYEDLMKAEPEAEVVSVFTAPKGSINEDTPQVKMAWEPDLPPKKEELEPMPSPIYKYTNGTCTRKSDALIYRAEDGRKLDDINLLIRHLRDMHITDDEKKRLHTRLSQMRTEVESIVLFGE